MSDRSDAAQAARATAQALRDASVALAAGDTDEAAAALAVAANAQDDAAGVYGRAAQRAPRPMQGQPLPEGAEEARVAATRA